MLKKSDQWSFFGNQRLMDTERWDAGGTGLTKHDKLMGVPLVTVLTVWPGEYPSYNKKQVSSLPSPNLCQGRFISWENMIRILPTLKSPIVFETSIGWIPELHAWFHGQFHPSFLVIACYFPLHLDLHHATGVPREGEETFLLHWWFRCFGQWNCEFGAWIVNGLSLYNPNLTVA